MSTENKETPNLIKRLVELDNNIVKMRTSLHQALTELDNNAVAVQRGIAEIQVLWSHRNGVPGAPSGTGYSTSALAAIKSNPVNADASDHIYDTHIVAEDKGTEEHPIITLSKDPIKWAEAVGEAAKYLTASLTGSVTLDGYIVKVADFYHDLVTGNKDISITKINTIINSLLREGVSTARLNSPELFSRVVTRYQELAQQTDALLRLPPTLYSFCGLFNREDIEYEGVVEVLESELKGANQVIMGAVNLSELFQMAQSENAIEPAKELAELFIASAVEGMLRETGRFPAQEYHRRRVKEQFIAEGMALYTKNKAWRAVLNDVDDHCPLPVLDVAYQSFEELSGEKGIDPTVLEMVIKSFLTLTITKTTIPPYGHFFENFEKVLDVREEEMVANRIITGISSKDARTIGRIFGELDHENITSVVDDLLLFNATPELTARVSGGEVIDVVGIVETLYELIVLTYMDSTEQPQVPGVSEGVVKKLVEFKEVVDGKAAEIADRKAGIAETVEYVETQPTAEEAAPEVEEEPSEEMVAAVDAALTEVLASVPVPLLDMFRSFCNATGNLEDESEQSMWQQRIAKALQWHEQREIYEARGELEMTVPDSDVSREAYSAMANALGQMDERMKKHRLYDDLRLAYAAMGLTDGELGSPEDQVGTAADSFVSGKQGAELVKHLLRGPQPDDRADFLASDGRTVSDQIKSNQEGRQEQNAQEWAVKFRNMAAELIRGMFTSDVTEHGDGFLAPQLHRQKLYRHDLTTMPASQWTDYPQGFYGLADAEHRSYLYKVGTAFNALFILSPLADLKLYDPASGEAIDPAKFHEFNMEKMEAFFDTLKERLEKLTEQ